MAKTKVLITVKTYPTPSQKYEELVCTAGFTEDGSWIRIFPIPFRKLDFASQYRKYQWIELDLVKNEKDKRRESYKPLNIDDIKVVGEIDTEKGTWRSRKNIVFKSPIYTCFDKLIKDAYDPKKYVSLAVFKPKKIIDLIITSAESDWKPEKKAAIEAKAAQLDLFKKSEVPFNLVQKCPWKFQYRFSDENNKVRTLMIEDWEIIQLYWNCLANNEGDEDKALKDVVSKYKHELVEKKDLHLFVGTTYVHHMKKAPNPFVIIGAFYPKVESQLSLF